MCVCSVTRLWPTLCDPVDCSPPGSPPWNFPGMNTAVGCHFLLQGIFPTEEWNLHLLHWQVAPSPPAPRWMPIKKERADKPVWCLCSRGKPTPNTAWIRCSGEHPLNHGRRHDCSANTLPSYLHGRCFLILTTPAWNLVMSFYCANRRWTEVAEQRLWCTSVADLYSCQQLCPR